MEKKPINRLWIKKMPIAIVLLMALFIILTISGVYAFPSSNLISPSGTYSFGKVGSSLNLNWTIAGSNIASCWYQYNNTNTSLQCLSSSASYQSNGNGMAQTSTGSVNEGVKIKPLVNITVYNFTLSPLESGNAQCGIIGVGLNVIKGGTITNHICFLNSPANITAGIEYYLMINKTASTTEVYNNTGIDINNTFIEWMAGFYNNALDPSPHMVIAAGFSRSLSPTNSTTFSQAAYQFRNLTFYVNDSSGNINSSYTSWDYGLFENSQTFLSDAVEGTLQNFSININLNNSNTLSYARLWYNNTAYSASIIGSNPYDLIADNIYAPSVSSNKNISFFWEIQLSNSENINLSLSNQTVLNIAIDNCAANTFHLLDAWLYDQEFQTNLNGTIEYNVNIFTKDRSQKVISLSGGINNTHNIQVCLSINLTEGSSYYLDSTLRYTSPGYSIQFYNIQNYDLNAFSLYQNISLYDLNSADSTNFQLTFTGIDFLPQEGVVVLVERQYLAEDVFKTVEAPLTDTNGQTILHLVKDDVIYNLKFMKNGILVKSFSNLRAFCDPTIGSCTISLNAISPSVDLNYNHNLGIVYSNPPTYNSTSGRVTFSFTSFDGQVKDILLEVERSDVFGNNSICSNSLETISGSISCQVPAGISDTNLEVTVSVNGKVGITTQIPINNSGFGDIGAIAWFILTLGAVLMFSNDKNGVLLALLFCYIGAVSLGFVVGGIIGVGTAGIAIITMTAVGLWKLNKNKSGD